ncbi:MAG TPA: SIR2 family protein [Saprospiraceae bacterium]|nr:SIR2 family protein [Saprospiraceae bacterium]
MAVNKINKLNFVNTLKDVLHTSRIGDPQVFNSIIKFSEDKLNSLTNKIKGTLVSWEDFGSFWPPRLLTAYKHQKLVSFFGAGVSIPSGLPSWNTLLTNYLKLDNRYITDKDLEYDPLTLAELASNLLGSENLQIILRNEYNKPNANPVTNHYILAALRFPIYITTNYDEMFETAWKVINPNIQLHVLTNDIDLLNNQPIANLNHPNSKEAYLFKIHGCVTRKDEQLILTRKDYRLHYRSNSNYFNQIREVFKMCHVLFVGFSHKDMEVTRLVEDVIFEYENEMLHNRPSLQPNFYSLQFDMLSHTPEIFAAKGIVAIEPPLLTLTGDHRSLSLNAALTELFVADAFDLESTVSLETELKQLKDKFELALQDSLSIISKHSLSAINSLKKRSSYTWLKTLQIDLDILANEGVYLCDDQGVILEHELPQRYSKASRPNINNTILNDRPYFRQSKTFRKPFISDSFKSVFNGNSTFTICLPIIDNNIFQGLLFSACQIGDGTLPLNEAKLLWKKNFSFILLDSNGNCLIPPNDEFETGIDSGYSFDKLLFLSKKDKVISRLVENVLPINKDDDVISISGTIKYYCLVTEIKNTRWKAGVGTVVYLSN